MTIAVAIRTLSAIVFAADSKLTTAGRVGVDGNGNPIVERQTYSNAVKIVSDAPHTGMAAVVGGASLGNLSFMDYIESNVLPTEPDAIQRQAALVTFAEGMGRLRTSYWSGVSEGQWPDTVLLLATSSRGEHSPSLWRIEFSGNHAPKVDQITNPIYFEGSYLQVFSLMYGYAPYIVGAAAAEVPGLDPNALTTALSKSLKVLKPVEQINAQVMPIQDAMDLAYFLANTQIQMERFLPGEPLCGGPIDLMVLKTSPNTEILWLPGKEVHHPGAR